MLTVLILIVGGIAAGYVATRLLRLETDLITTSAIGVLGVVVGVFALRLLFAAATIFGVIAAAFAGALALAWLYRAWVGRR